MSEYPSGIEKMLTAWGCPPVVKTVTKTVEKRVLVPAESVEQAEPLHPVKLVDRRRVKPVEPVKPIPLIRKPVKPTPEEQAAGDAMGMMLVDPVEPSDYIQPDWADYAFNYWHRIKDSLAVIFGGARGTGKTLTAIVLAARMGRKLLICNCNPDMTAESLIGTPRLNLKEHGGDYLQPGPILVAAKTGAVLLLDEMNLMPSAVQAAMNPVIDTVQRGLTVQYTGERISWENPRVICCLNEGYAGTKEIQQAFRDRPESMVATYLPPADEVNLLIGRTGCARDDAEKAVKTASAIRAAATGDASSVTLPIDFDLSPRALISFCSRVVAGQEPNRAWREAVLNRIGYSARVRATLEAVKQLSINAGGFNL
jgi:hypothetical protein